MSTAASIQYTANNQGAQRFTAYLFVVTTSMIFAGFTSAFIVQKGHGGLWVSFKIPTIFIYSTITIILSSISLFFAHKFNKAQNKLFTMIGLMITLILGILFCIFQIQGWTILNQNGIYLSFNPNIAAPYFLVITFMHALHVFFGLLFLSIAFTRSVIMLKRSNSATIINEIETSDKGILNIRTDLLSIFWHFMCILWLYLYFFLTFNI